MKESNPKVVNAGFDLTQIILSDATIFQPLINVTFDILLVKMGDIKCQVRSRATEVLVAVVISMGIPAGVEKLLTFINHRNAKAREHLLYAICNLVETGTLKTIATATCSKVITLLGDVQPPVRKAAIETLAKFHELYGMLREYESLGVKSTQIRLIEECIQRPAISQKITVGVENVNSRAEEINEISKEKANISDTTVAYSEKFSPSSYLNLLFEGTICNPIRLYSETDLEKHLNAVTEDLSNTEEWEARMKALATLQGLALGDAMEYPSFPSSVKLLHDLINAQVSDLRSTLCKEACRTVAVLARKMGAAFFPTAELLIPSIMKQASVKTQIMASAAERSLKIIIAASNLGSQRLAVLLFEYASNKALMSTIRRIAVEVLCIAAALWPADLVDKILNGLKTTITNGVSDADKDVRRVSRQLFWVLHAKSEGCFRRDMDALLADLEANSQKHIQQEMLTPSTDLLQLLSKPSNPPDTVMPEPTAQARIETRRQPAESSKPRPVSNEPLLVTKSQVVIDDVGKKMKTTSLNTKVTLDSASLEKPVKR